MKFYRATAPAVHWRTLPACFTACSSGSEILNSFVFVLWNKSNTRQPRPRYGCAAACTCWVGGLVQVKRPLLSGFFRLPCSVHGVGSPVSVQLAI